MPIRPDFSRRETWIGLLRQVAGPSDHSETGSDLDRDPPPIRPFGTDDPAVRAWSLLDSSDLDAAAAGLLELAGRRSDDPVGPRPFLPEREDLATEVWTECELSVLHAVWRVVLGIRATETPASHFASRLASRLADRVQEAVDWHLDRTQPDNATTHPWAIHAFLELGRPSAEAIDYAGSILHAVEAARSARGAVDPLSRWIMLDAASELERGGDGVSFLGAASP